MRTGALTVHQTLTSEAASILKHSLTLARRRGHSQVTPLHVATTLLSSRASLDLKRACLKSQLPPHHHQTSVPLHCRALELCFNVALNRLPTTPSPLLHSQQPSLSNALIAALKRAQAHQRRGCIENQQNQQQPLLAIKVELEQLILSILDDPSVSRVMREAGFSSTAVKSNLEDSVFHSVCGGGAGVYSTPSSPSPPEISHREISNFWQTHFLNFNPEQNPLFFSPQKKLFFAESVKEEDIKLVLEVLCRKNKKRNTVIVGDSLSITEAVVEELMVRVEKGDVPGELKSAHFIKFQFTSAPLRLMKREEVEQNISDLKRKVDGLTSGGERVIIYTGDLKWTVETRVNSDIGRGDISGYDPVDHLVAGIGRLVSEYSNLNSRVWLMGTANYETYIKCQMKQPSLEIQWSLQAVSVPSGGLGLSLHATSGHESRLPFSDIQSQVLETKPSFTGKEELEKLRCCAECTSKFETEASLYKSSCNTKDMDKGSTQLPHWLQSQGTKEHQKDDLVELRRKWNRMCHSQHQGRNLQNNASSFLLGNQSLSGKNYYTYAASHTWSPNLNSKFPDSNSISFAHSTSKPIPTATPLARFRRQQSCHIEFSFSNGDYQKHPSLEPNLDSLKKTEGKEVKITLALGNSQLANTDKLVERRSKICKKLQENVPWQSEIIPSMVEALIESKPGKRGIWLMIEGNDWIGKRRLARVIAESVLGSTDFLFQMNMGEETEGKVRLERALNDRKKLLVLVENVDLADTQFMKFLGDGFETGKFGESREKGADDGEAIFILTKGEFGKDLHSVIPMKLEVSGKLPNSDNKRKAGWDFPDKAKSPRIDGKENEKTEKEFTRQLSSNKLDLNMKAEDEDNENEAKTGYVSPISSDLSHESKNPHGFLEVIKNRYIWNWDSARESQVKEMTLSKIRGCFEEVNESEGLNCQFDVEERVIEEVLVGFGSFLENLFEKWLKEVFRSNLQTVKIGGKEEGKKSVRLCLGEGNEESSGFMGSSLPMKIQVSFVG
ncbi:protein SMAX1-LIKE 4-like isoform X2 [Rhododendron vialii]|uniref:protein SMAX1-LIKE 4-like isoform X2 n=1 Tax=Rhododendron vialii TaxID=182163 RepID=UPI00265DA882|nr:protein SMAX1-LIKE 4-like isoform X2 [Rhododendron vialii]